MGRNGVQYDDVARVADQLLAEGQRVTIDTVRHALGDTGSRGTIHRHIEEWKAKRPSTAHSTSSIPEELLQCVARVIDRKRNEAVSDIDSRLSQAQTDASRLAAEVERMEDEIEALDQRAYESAQTQSLLTGRIEELERQSSESASEHAMAIDRLQQSLAHERQTAETVRTELAKVQLRLEALPKLEKDVDAGLNRINELQERAHLAERELSATKASLASMTTVADELRQAVAGAHERLQSERKRNVEMAEDVATLRAQLASAITEAAAYSQHLYELRTLYKSPLVRKSNQPNTRADRSDKAGSGHPVKHG